jgi:hypothetical protein
MLLETAHDYSKYPAGSDVAAIFDNTSLAPPEGASSWADSEVDWDGAIEASIEEWEDRTGWRPFLSSGSQTRLFDPPGPGTNTGGPTGMRGGRWLELRSGIIDMPDDGLAIGVTAPQANLNLPGQNLQVVSSGSKGTVLNRDVQYFLRPNEAGHKKRPYTSIEFLTVIRGLPKSISVTAVWGRCRVLPADVWMMLVRNAAAILIPEIAPMISGGTTGSKTEDMDFDYVGPGVDFPLAGEAKAWRAKMTAMVVRYKRVTV